MRITRARYVTVCQQFLVTFVVLALGATAAGVTTLHIVRPDSRAPDLLPTGRTQDTTYADDSPVTPKVTELRVQGIDPAGARLPATGMTRQTDPQDLRIARSGTPVPRSSSRRTPSRPLRQAVLTAPEAVHGYATVGATWKHGVALAEDAVSVQVRTERDGRWSPWTVAQYHDDHGPDAADGAETARERPGTDALVVGDVDRVQMRAFTTSGTAPADLRLALIDPGAGTVSRQAPAIDTAAETTSAPSPGDRTAQETAVTLSAMRASPRPQIYSRAQWGANEKLRDPSSLHYGTIKTGFVHHTVNANDYTAAQVPALIRGIYAYHTQSRHWSDIGYNFLVDRFGRIWEGRYGGVDKAVVGAHTLGYNEVSFAMSAIGNFDTARPPQAVLNAYARLFAWKLSLYNIPANATHLWVKDRYLNAINGHRDVGQTACPGRYLYAKIPTIRAAARRVQLSSQIGFAGVRRTTGRWGSLSRVAAVGDVTGDGRGDVLGRSRSGVVRVYRGDGRGHVRRVGKWSTHAFARTDLIVGAGDLTGDRRPDVVARDRVTKRLFLYPGRGHGRFGGRHRLPGGWRAFSAIAVPGDLTGDGRPDLLALGKRAVWVSPGGGGARFGKRRVLFRLGGHYTDLLGYGDVTGDRIPDVIVRSARGKTRIYRGTGHGRVGGSLGPFGNLAGLRSITAGPMNGSPAADVVGVDPHGRLAVVATR